PLDNPKQKTRFAVLLFVWLTAVTILATTLTAFSQPFRVVPAALNETDLPLTSPCASGEALPEWVVCVYGTVFDVDGEAVAPVAGAVVSITLHGRTVTGTTYLHPDEITPTYSIDISTLEPKFLQPVSLTAAYGDDTAVYELILNPDFNTLSQRFDIPLTLDRGLLWGYVTDYISGTAVAEATVSAANGNSVISVTTQQRPYDPLPYYSFTAADLDAINVTTGELLTLTASYQGDRDQITVIRPLDTRQFNFSTRWYCDDFEALPREGGLGGLPREGGLGGLPREGGLGGLPREGGLGGLPNVACLWGYVSVDRQLRSGVAVNLTISDTVYAGTTRLFSGETIPRYGIAVPADVLTDGQNIAATAVYSGATAVANVPAALNAGYSQQIDLQISGLNALGDFVNASIIDDVYFRNNNVWWLSRGGGIVLYDPANSSLSQLTTLDGFPSNEMRTMADSGDGTLWFGSDAGVTRYNPTTNLQQTWGEADGLFGIPLDIAITAEGILYIATTKGYSTLNPATGAITNETTASSGLSANPLAVAYDAARHDIWFGTINQGADRFDLDGNTWTNFTTPDLSSATVNEIVMHSSGEIWFATENGVTRLVPDPTPVWQQFNTPDLPSDTVRSIDATAASIWIATSAGAAQYDFFLKSWTIYDLLDGLATQDLTAVDAVSDTLVWLGSNGSGLITFDGATWGQVNLTDSIINNNVQALDQTPTDGTLWFGTAAGVSHYRPNLIPRWENFDTFGGLNGNDVQALVVAPDESVWVGTNGTGAAHYESGLWSMFSSNEGLSNDDVQAIAVDFNNVAWFGT
ncbi:MAG: hypothetical protein KDE51_22840, partial [Anaerolineales bacterium]|nr:hypothetical protein [Anaerolineales bacterium]